MAFNSNALTLEQLPGILDQITSAGLSQQDALSLAGDLLLVNSGLFQRTFNYTTPFPPVDPAALSLFVRKFHHQDWVDGESVVQAEQTVGEDGFNLRFHNIEHDLDQLKADFVTAFNAMAQMRSSIRSLLDELRLEINRINADLSLRPRPESAVPIGPTRVGTTNQFLGTQRFFDRDVQVFQTDQGVLMLPTLRNPVVDPNFGNRVGQAGGFAGISALPDVRGAFPGPVSPEELVGRFGDLKVDDSTTVRQLLEILPANSRFASLDEMVNAVGDVQAAVIRTGTNRGAVGASLGIGSADPLSNVGVNNIPSLSPEVSQALSNAGIATAGQLAGAAVDTVVKALSNAGVANAAQKAASAVTAGKILRRV